MKKDMLFLFFSFVDSANLENHFYKCFQISNYSSSVTHQTSINRPLPLQSHNHYFKCTSIIIQPAHEF